MLDIVRDPLWQFVGVVLAVAGVGATLWVFWLQRQVKELAFGLVSSRRLLAVADEVSSRVTVLLDGRKVESLHLLVFGLKNSGHKAIVPSDFERPLAVSFGAGHVVSAQIVSQRPENIGAVLDCAEASVQLRPTLLNAGDQVLFQVLLSASDPSPTAVARILDVPKLSPIVLGPRRPPFYRTPLFPTLLLAGGIAIYEYVGGSSPGRMWMSFAIAVMVVLVLTSTKVRELLSSSERRFISEA